MSSGRSGTIRLVLKSTAQHPCRLDDQTIDRRRGCALDAAGADRGRDFHLGQRIRREERARGPGIQSTGATSSRSASRLVGRCRILAEGQQRLARSAASLPRDTPAGIPAAGGPVARAAARPRVSSGSGAPSGPTSILAPPRSDGDSGRGAGAGAAGACCDPGGQRDRRVRRRRASRRRPSRCQSPVS